jgi:hypothetical protein
MMTLGLSRSKAPNLRATIAGQSFNLICAWWIVGLAFTALSFALGFGAQVGQALAARPVRIDSQFDRKIVDRPMSLMGHFLPISRSLAMSAVPPEADVEMILEVE